MKKIIFGITSLTLGGAERVLVDLANRLCKFYDITIFTIYAKGELEKELSPDIKRISLYPFSFQELSNFQRKLQMPLQILLGKKHLYKKYIKKDYDIEIAFLEGPITRLFSIKNKNTRKIAWIHNDVSLVFGKGIKAKIKKKIDRNIYSKYETLVFVSKDNREHFEKVYPELRNSSLERIHKRVIYNYLDDEVVRKKTEDQIDITFDQTYINFVTVARLVEQKGIDRLIDVHTKLIRNGKKHRFYVIGDGPLREKLEEKIKKNKVEDSFFLLGKRENPYPYIKKADYFCLLSQFEGYPMVLLEAKLLNKKILITDTAAREVVQNYEKATIVENSEKGIYNGLQKIINQNKNKRKREKEEIKKNEENEKNLKKVITLLEGNL